MVNVLSLLRLLFRLRPTTEPSSQRPTGRKVLGDPGEALEGLIRPGAQQSILADVFDAETDF